MGNHHGILVGFCNKSNNEERGHPQSGNAPWTGLDEFFQAEGLLRPGVSRNKTS